ncbi:ATP synthase F1 subunit delta [Candidatus Falkowbacteria bacterium]|nr:ATP synthase F1 subunit delta [Candidatus Falkowbacteria bacterium]
MKISPKQFALSLYEAVDGKSSSQVKAVIEKFVEILAGKNMLAKADKIAVEFIKIWNEKRGIVEAQAASANNLDKANIKLLKDYIAELSSAKEVMLSEKIDKAILGGVIIKYGDRVVDGSLKTSLNDLKEKLVK